MPDRLAHAFAWIKRNSHVMEKNRRDAGEKQRASMKKYRKKRWDSDPEYRVTLLLRGRVGAALRLRAKKAAKTKTLLGCSVKELMYHLEKQFQPGMSWDNHGEWHIDHIKPCAKFNLLDPDEQRACFHYTNLQPLWAMDNFKKNDKWVEPEPD